MACCTSYSVVQLKMSVFVHHTLRRRPTTCIRMISYMFLFHREMGESAQEIAEAHKKYITDMRAAERYKHFSLMTLTNGKWQQIAL